VAERARLSLHATHDVELIAGWSTGDLDAHERSRAIGVIDACSECAALATDLQAISAAMTTLRYGSDALHRNFRLSAADAGRLQRGSALLRWLRPLAGSGFRFARPVGSLVTALALVGLVASSVPLGLNLADEAAPATDGAVEGRNSTVPTESPELANASPVAAADSLSASPRVSASAKAAHTEAPEPSRPRDGVLVSSDGGSTFRPLLIPSLLLLAAGLLLLIAPRLARRLVGPAREP
jgi:hypothetical protein